MDLLRQHHSPGTSRRAAPALILAAAVLVAFALRVHRTDVPFHTGDFATMPYLVSTQYGVNWIIAHTYGPLLAAVMWLFAHAVVAAGLVMNETLWRLPIVLLGTAVVPVTYVLMRRLGADRWAAVLAAGIVAVLPSMTSDARYPWGYETLGVCVGGLALWAWLRDLDHSTRGRRWLAGGLLGLYLLSHLVIHAVPLVMVAAALLVTGRRETIRRLLRLSTLVPVMAAGAVTLAALLWLNGGILGRIKRHASLGTLDIGASSVLDIAHHFNHHMGPIWSAVCLVGVVVGLAHVARGDRRGLPALWAGLYILPLMLLVDLSNIGRPTMYLIQGTYAATLAACMLVQFLWTATASWNRSVATAVHVGLAAFCVSMAALHLLGSISNTFLSRRWPAWTGTLDYGRVVADPGFKAAGWYVRRHVPPDAVVLATHGVTGLEYPCATYYTGRHVAAAEDTTYAQECRIVGAVRNAIDVAIVEPRYLHLFTDRPGFTIPVRIVRDDEPVLYIAARNGLEIPVMEVDVARANRAYDRQCRLSRVPTLVRELPRTSAVNRTILAVLRETDEPRHVAARAEGAD